MMDWVKQISGMLQQYGASSQAMPDQQVDNDFSQFSQSAPQATVADGLAASFRSQQTPPFPNMLGDLFARSGGQQRANILNTLLATAGPAVLSQLMNRGGGFNLGSLLQGGQSQVTPEQAEQIPAEAVQEIAQQAEQRDPSVVDRVSEIYAQNPTLFKTLGSAAMMVALTHLARRHNDGHF